MFHFPRGNYRIMSFLDIWRLDLLIFLAKCHRFWRKWINHFKKCPQ